MSISYLLSVLRQTAAKQAINIDVFNVEAVRQQLQCIPNNHMSEHGHRTHQQVLSTSLQKVFYFISTHFIERKISNESRFTHIFFLIAGELTASC